MPVEKKDDILLIITMSLEKTYENLLNKGRFRCNLHSYITR